jgi:hypothetical protein
MTLPGYQTYAPPAPPRRSGLARASQVLGIAGLVGLVFCLAGLIPALIGLVLGVISLVRKEPDRRPAVVGVVCSALALLIGASVALWLLSKAVQCADETKYPDETSRRGCVEREFPYARADVQSAGAVSAGVVSAGVVPHSAKARTASSLSAEA